MAFERQAVRTPSAIGSIEIRLHSPDPTGAGQPAAEFAVQVRYDNGEHHTLRGNLVPHLTAGQISALLSFMDNMRQQAITEILP